MICVTATASVIVLQLNAACTRLSFLPLGRHWMNVLTKPTASASAVFICAAATRMKGKFTDIVPVTPGSLFLSLAATQATNRKTKNFAVGTDLTLRTASPSIRRPEMTINATNIRAEHDFGMLVLSVLSVAQGIH